MQFSILTQNAGFFAWATLLTIAISCGAFVCSLVIAYVVGTLRSLSKNRLLNALLTAYIEVFRGTPLLVQLFFIYYGLPSVGISLNNYLAGVLGLALNSGAYIAEIVRSSLNAVDAGQREAAFSLGYTRWQTLYSVVFPQSFRIALPNLMNAFSSILKDSSLVSVLAITELTRSGQLIYTRTSRAFEVYLMLGVLYFVMTFLVSLFSRWLEQRIGRKYAI